MTSMGRSCLAATLAMGAAIAASGAEPEGWAFEVTPYAWLAGLSGDVKVNGHKAEFDKSAADLFEAFDIGGSLLAVAQYDRVLLLGQVDYFSLSTDELDVEDQPAGGSLDSDMTLGKLAVGYQFDGWSDGVTVDLLLGAQSLTLDNDLTVSGLGTESHRTDMVNPLVMVRPNMPVWPSKIGGLRFCAPLSVGGGGDADLVYDVELQVQCRVATWADVRLGYRAVGFQVEEDDQNELDVVQSGWTLGVGLWF